ncbi:hypothetical protein BDV97DRAFT_357937 [Delphinella strobiligena]|nr:hypothetical protein BDV97DRAFT_357937 [Delphinella strobiligena]
MKAPKSMGADVSHIKSFSEHTRYHVFSRGSYPLDLVISINYKILVSESTLRLSQGPARLTPKMCTWENVKYEACGHEARTPNYCKNAPVINKKYLLSGIVPFSAWGHQACLDWEAHQSKDNPKYTPFKPGKCMGCRRWMEKSQKYPQVYPGSRVVQGESQD